MSMYKKGTHDLLFFASRSNDLHYYFQSTVQNFLTYPYAWLRHQYVRLRGILKQISINGIIVVYKERLVHLFRKVIMKPELLMNGKILRLDFT